MRIDCQTHVFPSAYIDIISQNPSSPQIVKKGNELTVMINDRPTLKMEADRYSLDFKLKDMDRFGIDISILSPNIPSPCMLAPDLALKGAQVMNDYIGAAIKAHPDRYAGIACLAWHDVQASITEMDRAKDVLGLSAIMLFSHVGGRPVDDPEFEPIYAHAEARGLPIVLHPSMPTWGEAIKDYMMVPMIGFMVDNSFALLRLILSGILEKYPRLKILMPHIGGVLPYVIGRIDYQTEVMGRARERITKPPSEYLQDIFYDTVSPSPQAIKYAYDSFGAGKLLFGTDHPWVDTQMFVKIIEEMEIPPAEKEQIFSGNAMDFFGLK